MGLGPKLNLEPLRWAGRRAGGVDPRADASGLFKLTDGTFFTSLTVERLIGQELRPKSENETRPMPDVLRRTPGYT